MGKKKLVFANELALGDHIKVGGNLCEVTKTTDVFHYKPQARVRLELRIVGATQRNSGSILLLPSRSPVYVHI